MEKTLESAFYMIKQKISKASSLSEKTTWADTDLIIVEDGADTKKMTVATLKVLIRAIPTVTPYTETIIVTTAQTVLVNSFTSSVIGKSLISFSGAADVASFTGMIELKILLNGVQKSKASYYYNASGYPQPQVIAQLSLVIGDIVTFAIVQSSGSNKSFVCNMEVTIL